MSLLAKLTARNAVKEIDEVPWQLLLAILGIDQSLETQIFAETDYPNNIKSMERVLCNWMEYYESSWETLAMSLMSVPFTRAKGAYIYNKYVNPESEHKVYEVPVIIIIIYNNYNNNNKRWVVNYDNIIIIPYMNINNLLL